MRLTHPSNAICAVVCVLCLRFCNAIMRLGFLRSEFANPQPQNTCMNVTGISSGKKSCGSYAEVKGENADFAESAQIKMCYQESVIL